MHTHTPQDSHSVGIIMEGLGEGGVEGGGALGSVGVLAGGLLPSAQEVPQHPPCAHRPLVVPHAGVDLGPQQVHLTHLKCYLGVTCGQV